MSSRRDRSAAMSGKTDDWTWTTDGRFGVQRRINAAMNVTAAAVLMVIIREPSTAIPHPGGGEQILRRPKLARVARNAHVRPSTVRTVTRRLVADGWLRPHRRGWVDGPLLTDAIAAAGEPDAGRDRLHTRADVSAITGRLAAAAEHDPDRPDRPTPTETVVIEAMLAIAADAPMMDRPQAAIAELTGIDEADVCRSMQRLERWGIVTIGRRHMATEDGDPNPRALRVGASLAQPHHELLPARHRSAAGRWCRDHGRDRPDPQTPTLPGMRPRHQRSSRAVHGARCAAIAERRRAAAAHRRQTRPDIAAAVAAAPFAAPSHHPRRE